MMLVMPNRLQSWVLDRFTGKVRRKLQTVQICRTCVMNVMACIRSVQCVVNNVAVIVQNAMMSISIIIVTFAKVDWIGKIRVKTCCC